MKKEKTIYDLELHDKIYINNGQYSVTRVAGGWIYTKEEPMADTLSSTFITYNNEFRKTIKFDVPKYKREDIEIAINMLESYLRIKKKFLNNAILQLKKQELYDLQKDVNHFET